MGEAERQDDIVAQAMFLGGESDKAQRRATRIADKLAELLS